MDVWAAISTKRVVRRFEDRPIEPDQLDRILNAGRRAASSKNLQRWDFIVCLDRAHLGELAAVGPFARHLAGAAAGIALVTPDPRGVGASLSIMFDLGQAAANMMLAAWELGSSGSAASPPPSTSMNWPVACSAIRARCGASTSSRSATRPMPRRSPRPRVEAVGARSMRSSTGSAGKASGNALAGPTRRLGPARGYCQRKKRAEIPKQSARKPARTAKQTHNGESGVPWTMIWRRASDR